MKGSYIATQIEGDIRREKYWKTKKIRQKCTIDNKKQCDKCGYARICENVEKEKQNSLK